MCLGEVFVLLMLIGRITAQTIVILFNIFISCLPGDPLSVYNYFLLYALYSIFLVSLLNESCMIKNL